MWHFFTIGEIERGMTVDGVFILEGDHVALFHDGGRLNGRWWFKEL
jgi:hypothetical protein